MKTGFEHLDDSDLSKRADAELKAMSTENLKNAILIAAGVLSKLKAEAVRRGIWEEMKGRKPNV
jgi:hypothetical protein